MDRSIANFSKQNLILEKFSFGDARLNKRGMKMMENMSKNMGKTIPQIFSSHAELHGAYRFFNNDLVTPEKILEPHKRETIQRIKTQNLVLLLQDSTDLTYDYLEDLEGLNPLHPNVAKGIRLHPLLAVTSQGTPLGIVDSMHYTRSHKEEGKKHRNSLSIEKKESFRWLNSYRKSCEIAQEASNTTVINIADQEGDIYECLAEAEDAASGKKAHIIFRAKHNRCLENESDSSTNQLKKKLIRSSVVYEAQLNINKGKTNARTVNVAIRATAIQIKAPNTCLKKSLNPVRMNAILVSEIEPSKKHEPIEWVLLTTLPINTREEISQIVNFYGIRWQIEIFFKVLKSGCQLESIHLQSVPRIEKYIALSLIVAWKTMLATYLPREYPDAPCTLVFTDVEWKLAYRMAYEKKRPLPKEIPTLKEVSALVANLGGYILKKKTPPGIQSMWRGIIRLMDMVEGYDLAHDFSQEKDM
jgi:hypothetical protein